MSRLLRRFYQWVPIKVANEKMLPSVEGHCSKLLCLKCKSKRMNEYSVDLSLSILLFCN